MTRMAGVTAGLEDAFESGEMSYQFSLLPNPYG